VTDLIQHLRRVVLRCDGAGLSDDQLLECFVTGHDEEAFAALVHRHGPMVWNVCRRLLRCLHDAEDAFQATFLVLARKGASVRPRECVGNWLYGVAYRTALRARSSNARRREKESETVDRCGSDAAEDEGWLELLPYLDRELNRLPDKYRLPVVLCELEGRSRKEVAGQLRIPEGTLSSRLATARKLLAGRLHRHGLTLAGAALTALMAQNGASACLPKELVISTVKAAGLVAAGRTAAGVVSTAVATLTEGVVKSMLLSKLRSTVVLLLAVTVLTIGAGLPAYRIWAAAPSGADENALRREGDTDKASPREKGAPNAPKPERGKIIQGSGKLVTKEMKFADFASVEVGNIFSVEIMQGDSFRTAVTADDNLFDYIKVSKEGTELRVRLDSEGKSFRDITLKAAITMPSLSGLNIGGASQAAIKGFKGGKAFRTKAGGASQLKGDIETAELRLEVSGASRISLEGSAKTAILTATGASDLRLANLPLDRATVRLSGASHAAIQVKDKLDYTVDGASSLEYRGKPTLGEKKVSGASSATRK
jgi:RNA polymerase sigma factor (sigma-70 family)